MVIQKTSEYRGILEKMKTVAASDSYVRDMEINALLSQLLVLLMEDSWNPESNAVKGKRVQVVRVREYIDSNYASEITLEGLAAQFFINKTYLSEMFKEQYGIALKDYLVSVRITEAKRLLRFTDKTTEEIAETFLFTAHFRISHICSQNTVFTPSARQPSH